MKTKLAFITGAGAGIGYECASVFAAAGCDIIATDCNQSALQSVKDHIQAIGRKCYTYTLDVSNAEQFESVADDVVIQVGCPDIVINNAGIGFIGSVENTSLEMWKRTLDVNLLGVVHGSRAFLPAMRKNTEAAKMNIVNVSSLSTKSSMPNLSAYVASKYAVEGFSEVLDMELNGSNIFVTTVHPAVINTAIVKNEAMVGDNITDEQIVRLQSYYQNKGCHPRKVAEDILAAVKGNKAALYTGPLANFTALMYRLMPKRQFRNTMVKVSKHVGYL